MFNRDDERGLGRPCRRRRLPGLLGGLGVVWAASVGCSGDDGPQECLEAVIFDIDETLTIDDEEWETQKKDGTYDPIAREAAAALVNAYAERGYVVVYLTARAKTWVLGGTGEGSPAATERWLVEHGFPRDPARTRLIMSEMVVPGDAARAYKREALEALLAEGLSLEAAYGNAVTDVGAFEDVMIPKSVTFIIGEFAGSAGTVAIAGESWLPHVEAYVPGVRAACAP